MNIQKSYQTCEMAHIIQAMQTDIAEMKQERIVQKFLVLFHAAQKVLWDDSFIDGPITRLSKLRHGSIYKQ